MSDNIVLKISAFSNRTEKRRKIISFLGRISPYTVFILYFVFSLKEIFILKLGYPVFFVIPFLSFVTVSVIRSSLNRKRPFELYDIPKLIPHGNGKSFPSRHSASCVAISIAVSTVSRPFGIAAFICSAVICVTRVLCGVHFIKDVLAGIFVGAVFWIIYFIFSGIPLI